MKAVIQRVKNASVSVGGKTTGSIDEGMLVYLGVALNDSEKDALWMAEKIAGLRIFDDEEGKMNLSIDDLIEAHKNNARSCKTGILAVSQFTLLGDARKGRRPSWGNAACPGRAKPLYEFFIKELRASGLICEEGVFQAHMEVTYTNDGPVTLLLDTGQL